MQTCAPTLPKTNKRVLGPWVARLRVTVYKGIRKHSATQSPAMNFDRSAVSLRLYMGYVGVMLTKLTGCRNSISKTCDIRSVAILGPQKHNLNKLG